MSVDRYCPICNTRLAKGNPNKYCFAHCVMGANMEHIGFLMNRAMLGRRKYRRDREKEQLTKSLQ